MQFIQNIRKRISQTLTTLDRNCGILAWAGSHDRTFEEDLRRFPLVDWTSVQPNKLAGFLRSDELAFFEMMDFRSDHQKIRPPAVKQEKHWKRRDETISEARAVLGLPIVSEQANKYSLWARKHRSHHHNKHAESSLSPPSN